MRIDIMTLFPETVGDVLSESILGRAQERGFITIRTHQIRDYTTNKQNQVDNYPYGGGHGAVMQADPLYRCWDHICQETGTRPHTIYLSPCGTVFDGMTMTFFSVRGMHCSAAMMMFLLFGNTNTVEAGVRLTSRRISSVEGFMV